MASKKKGGCFKYLLIIIVAIFVINKLANSDLFSSVTPTNPDPPPVSVDENVADFFYEQLTPTEKDLYTKLLEVAKTGKFKCTITDVDADVYADAGTRAVAALVFDHPELFWLSGAWESNGNRLLGTITFTLYPYEFWNYVYEPQKYVESFEKTVNAVVAKAAAYSSPYEQAKFVHDYINDNTYYDHDRLAEAQKTFHLASSEYIYSAYGCLIQEAAVCAGYARAYQVIMNRLGYTCTYVRGDAGGSHAWNYIELDGDGYFVDTTWDDADWYNDSGVLRYPDDTEYDYFLITTAELTKTHTIDETLFDIPTCTALDYNYYRYNDYYVQTYDFDTVADILDDQADKLVVCVQFSSASEMDKAKVHLMDQGNWVNVPSLKGRKIRYVVDTHHTSITILK